ncbi:phosphoribosylanthranilate isomerase [Bacillus sp. NPDC077027]|uniref:phosphoribosylanthranilate isomerase n=1 Tax=Bacillus sp. NPDC077027 TaxID=3390548 RepID=UPI003CFFFE5E
MQLWHSLVNSVKDLFVKYCGVQSLEDVQLVSQSMANAIGFIFAPSKRRVSPKDVKSWLEKTNSDKQVTGVFVNEDIEVVCKVAKYVPLNIVQLHGDETPDEAWTIKQKTKVLIWKAFHHQADLTKTLEQMNLYAPFVDGFLIDSKVEGIRGGSGTAFAWEAVPLYVQHARNLGKACVIAGGIGPDSIHKLLTYQPDAIDLASGIEVHGRKSKEKMKQLEERMLKHVRISE